MKYVNFELRSCGILKSFNISNTKFKYSSVVDFLDLVFYEILSQID